MMRACGSPSLVMLLIAAILSLAITAHAHLPIASTPHTTYPSRAFRHLEPVADFRVVHSEMHLASPKFDRFDAHGHVQPLPDQVTVEFSVYGVSHSYELEINQVFAPGTTLKVVSDEGETEVSPTSRSYRRDLPNGGWAAATFNEDGTMHAAFNIDGELLQIDPLSTHEAELQHSVFHQLNQQASHRMVAVRGSDMILDGDNLHMCGSVEDPEQISEKDKARAVFNSEPLGPVRRLLTVDPWTDCRSPWTKLKLFVGVAVDFGFYKAVGGTVAKVNAYLAQAFNSINNVYTTQLNEVLWIQDAIIMTTTDTTTYPWNQDRLTKTCNTIGDTLVTLTTWRKSAKPTLQGQWALVTDCYPPPGTTGIAYMNGLCSTRVGTSVSTFTSKFWVTVAHEIGHNHGAAHTFQLGKHLTGGIMDYGDGKLNGEYQFYRNYSEAEMCAQINKALSKTSRTNLVPYANCWASAAAVCGNGIVEAGEACDDTSGCCDMSTCQFKAGTQCTSGDCCSNCKFKPTTSACSPLPAVDGGGYCANGVCKASICGSFSVPFCGVDPTNTCKMKCTMNGVCDTMASYHSSKTGLPIATTIDDGTVCNTSPYSTCQSGVCKSLSTSPTITYSWVSGVYGACPVTCGSGTMTRSVSCQNSNKVVVADSFCTGTKPATTTACTGLPVCASYSWKLSTWSTCTKDCGSGSQTATVSCVSSTGTTVTSSFCTSTKPATTRSCNTAACGVSWSVGEWSTCSKACGSGIQTRTISCVQTLNGAKIGVAASLCAALASPGATSQSCNTDVCGRYDWVYTNWGTCSRTCDTGMQTRTVQCRSTTTGLVASSSSLCTSGPPQSSQVCATNRCPVYQWYMGSWSSCSVTCGGGRRTRTVYCREVTGNSHVEDDLCITQKPASTETCSAQACSSVAFVTSAWTTCTASCGGGFFSRTVQCLDANNVVRNESECNSLGLTFPDAQGVCNLQACPTFSWFIASTAPCSATLGCGGGTQSRIVVCIKDGSSTVVDANLCDAASKPSETLACNTATCEAYNWVPSEWGACSVACAGGVHSRTLTCMSLAAVVADSTMCASATVPMTEEACNTHSCPVYWFAGPYGECSAVCGTGEKSRAIECHDTATEAVVDSSRCTDTMPSTNATCNTNLCPQWYPSEWSACSAPCDDGIQNRTLECRDVDGFVVDDLECTSDAPAETQPCNLMPCPHWHRDEWSDCSAVCDGGIQTRTTACRMPHDDPVWMGALASDPSLCPDEKPESSQECNTDPCTPYYWVPTWEPCSMTCGGGLQSATYQCINDSSTLEVDGENCFSDEPQATRTCNTQACPVYDWYLLGGDVWSACSYECGVGLETRDVVCANTVGLIAMVGFELGNDSLCADKVMPARSRICTQPTCGSNGMCIMGKCACSSGFHGTYCDQQAQLGMVMTNAALFSSAGIPSGEQLMLRWATLLGGDITVVSLLLTRPSWPFPIYIARQIPNTGQYLWPVASNLEPATDYTVLTWFSPQIFNRSEVIPIADPCAYRSCGQFGTCNKGRCECIQGYSGESCTLSPCAAAECNLAHSNCTDGVCSCADGYSGPQCMTPPQCSSTCLNGGYITDGDLEGTCSDCICPNFWTGDDCGKCSLDCQNGFSPNADCSACQCGEAESGYFGDHCECKFAIGKLTIRSPDLTWLDDTSIDGARWRFNATLASDLVSAIPGTESHHFVVIDAIASGLDVVVRFRINQECGTTVEGEAIFGRRLLQVATTGYIGAVPSVANMTASIRRQLADSTSDLYRGVITSAATGDFSVDDPTGITQQTGDDDGTNTPTTSTPGTTGKSEILPLWAWIAAGGGAALLIGGTITGCCIRKRRAARAQAKMKEAATEPAKTPSTNPTSPISSTETPLPEGWTQQSTPEGQTYYYNAATGVSEWVRPTAATR